MMHSDIPEAGAASKEIADLAKTTWLETAAEIQMDLTGFDPEAGLQDRLAWAKAHDLEIGGVLSRFSSKMQHSTDAQVRDCVAFAARKRIYTPPEFVCVDEAITGRKVRRDGLDRMKFLLKHKRIQVLLAFKVSRLFRVAYKGFQFFQEDVVEEGLRAISISQGIDTTDEKSWKPLAYLHGIMDEILLSTIADHVRSSLGNLVRMGYAVGATGVGFRRVEVPGAPPTKRGLPRTRPEVDPDVAKMIVEHYQLIIDGMPISHGWKKWLRNGGPRDPRSNGSMSYGAYRRMLSNQRLTGLFAYGRKRNRWSCKRDGVRQIDGPETEVVIVHDESLRILQDDQFLALQAVLAKHKLGRRGPKKKKNLQLWDLVTDCFHCTLCSTPEKPINFQLRGSNGRGMQCKSDQLCSVPTTVRRDWAVRAVCDRLSQLLQQDADLIEQTIVRAEEVDTAADAGLAEELAGLERKIAGCARKLDDLTELAGEGSEDDRATMKSKIRAVQADRATHQAEAARLRTRIHRQTKTITPEAVRAQLADIRALLEDGASGKLGEDLVYRAAAVFRQLVGGRIDVHVERRAARKRSNVRGSFRPALLRTLQLAVDDAQLASPDDVAVVDVWLRKPPRLDALADRVHQLMDVRGLSRAETVEVLQAEGHQIPPKTIWRYRRRYFELRGEPVPKLRYNNGRPRQR